MQARRLHQRQGPHLLLRREHLHARAVDATRFKVNFCKFTNETRLGLEELSAESGHRVARGAERHGRRAAATSWRSPATRSCSSTTASSAVSFPEAPLLGVLPGTGGLTRLVDKRKVRRDLADVFSHARRGHQGQARGGVGPRRRGVAAAKFDEAVRERARRDRRARSRDGAARRSRCRRSSRSCGPTRRRRTATSTLDVDRRTRAATSTVRAPTRAGRRPPTRSRRPARRRGRSAPSASSTTRSSTCASTTRASASSRCETHGRRRRACSRSTRCSPSTQERRPRARGPLLRCGASSSGSTSRRRASSRSSSRADAASPARCSSSRSPPTASTCSTTATSAIAVAHVDR